MLILIILCLLLSYRCYSKEVFKIYFIPVQQEVSYVINNLNILIYKYSKQLPLHIVVGTIGNETICDYFDFKECNQITVECNSISDRQRSHLVFKSCKSKRIVIDSKEIHKCIIDNLDTPPRFLNPKCININNIVVEKVETLKDIWGIKNSQYGVIHWERNNCQYVNETQYDFSINCNNEFKFLQVANQIRKENITLPIYIATNEKRTHILDEINRNGFLSQINIKKKHSDISPLLLSMLELTLLSDSVYLWGAGKSSIHKLSSSLRKKHSDWTNLPGFGNNIADNITSTNFLVDMILNLKTWTSSGTLDAVLICFHIEDIVDGKLDYFIKNMKTVSKNNHKPFLYFAATNRISDQNQKEVLEILHMYNFTQQFSTVSFLNLSNYHEHEISDTMKGKALYKYNEGPNGVFYEAMTILSTMNISTVLNLEPDVKFIHEFWFDDLYRLSALDTYWMYGSYYKGKHFMDRSYSSHLNGVAMYNLGNPNFIDFLSLLQSFHSYYEHVLSKNINYDIIWPLMKHYYYTKRFREHHDVSNKFRIIDGNLLTTNLILNFSPLRDIEEDISRIVELYPKTVLLHQKSQFLYNASIIKH